MHKRLLWIFAPILTAGICALPATASAAAASCTPAGAINLSTDWKLTLPTGSSGSPIEVKQPQLASYSASPWFAATADCGGIQFRAAVNGTTTSNSGYPRSELREMSGSGANLASWSTTSGTHTMIVDEAITHVPASKPEIVAGQIHDASSDLTAFRLKGRSLYVSSGNNSTYKLVTANYQPGTWFEAKFVVSGGKVKAYYNGVLQTTISSKSKTNYFKAGAYTQANCGNSSPCAASNYGEVVINHLSVTHS
ncbi:MAG: Alginate lyase 2 [Amycolatopsis sp.]|jgi:hypothetical protein|uniref:polysaccharide lyase family 7 protein n=1 Tax=Amycolatopsis sp. TaxID=37632 RepID=UPI002625E590|nr:polysaccharide lyase family 7 protein [Amycolatopsis sp.]MCU1688033.1 Alginate lyase 2 [Amycolatopsis sp.]